MSARWVMPVAGCFLAVLLTGYELAAYAAALPRLVGGTDVRLSDASAGVVASGAMAGMLVGGLGSARLSRRHPSSTVLRAAVATMVAGMAACTVATQPWALGVGRLLTGVGAGAAVPSAIALTAAVAPRRRRTAVHTLMFSGLQLGSALGALAAPVILHGGGWRPLFGVGAGAAACLVLVLPRLTRDGGGRAGAGDLVGVRALWTPATRRLTVTHWASTAMSLLVVYGLNAWLVQLLLDAGHGPTDSLRLLAVFNLGAVLGTPLAGLAADRWGQPGTAFALFAGGAVGLAVLATDPASRAASVLLWLAGLGTMGATTILNGATATAYGADLRATGLGWALGIGRLGAAAGPLAGGLLLGAGATPGALLLAFAAAALATAGLVASSPARPASPT
ncbi:MFS transporter [Nocardioides sp. R1-1]|uniref:MFS transporter n=1 Tax=Nocardioides sp. R1-1 TaxID=3383502 RepID=UPI0038D1EDE3